MANTVEAETPAERRDRWQLLTANLQTNGLQDVPDNLLLAPLETTRTGVPLVAHYDKVNQVSKGRTTPKEFVLLVIAILSLNLVTADPEGMKFWLLDSGHWAAQLLLILAQFLLAVLVVAIVIWWFIKPLFSQTGPLSLSLDELNLSLPDGNRHPQWKGVYSASVDEDEKPHWLIRKRARVRVELNDGLVAWLHVPRDDCKPLADLMQALIVCHR